MVKRILALSLLMVLSSCATGADDTVDSLAMENQLAMCCDDTNAWAGPLWVRKTYTLNNIAVCENIEAIASAQCNNNTAYFVP